MKDNELLFWRNSKKEILKHRNLWIKESIFYLEKRYSQFLAEFDEPEPEIQKRFIYHIDKLKNSLVFYKL